METLDEAIKKLIETHGIEAVQAALTANDTTPPGSTNPPPPKG